MTTTPFTGNATPVFLLDDIPAWLSDTQMQLLAREMNHSETAFLRKDPDREVYSIRWFTPFAEEYLCGHGVVGAGLALHAQYGLTHLTFRTMKGVVMRVGVTGTTVKMALPADPVDSELVFSREVIARFAAALGLEEVDVVAVTRNALMDVFIEVRSNVDYSAAARGISPVALLDASPEGTRSQVITSRSVEEGVDFTKRVFAYGSEDQATGSTYCGLGPYWSKKLGKQEMTCRQISFRGGGARIRCEGTTVEVYADGLETTTGSILCPDTDFDLRNIKARL